MPNSWFGGVFREKFKVLKVFTGVNWVKGSKDLMVAKNFLTLGRSSLVNERKMRKIERFIQETGLFMIDCQRNLSFFVI